MEREQSTNPEGDEKIVDGVKYRKVPSGYSIREYFSHNTQEKGPGPGWDMRFGVLEQYNVDDPSKLPDEPYYVWKEDNE